MCGRKSYNSIDFALIKPGFIEQNNKSSLPIRSYWIPSSNSGIVDSIMQYSFRLGKINAWLKLSNNDPESFPYSLELKRKSDGKLLAAGPIFKDEIFNFVLTADSDKLTNWKKKKSRYVYILGINNRGDISLLFPRPKYNMEKLMYPVDIQNSTSIINIDYSGFSIGSPYGFDTYILITSDSQIPNPIGLEQSGVQDSRSVSKDMNTNPLGRLLFSYGSKTRGDDVTISSNWSMQRLIIESKEK